MYIDVARSASCLAQVSYFLHKQNNVKRIEDYVEVERLFRKSIRIYEKINGKDCPSVVQALLALSDVLQLLQTMDGVQRRPEIKDLLDRSLILYTLDGGVDSSNVRIANQDLAIFHYDEASNQPPGSIIRSTELKIAESHYEETIRIGIKLFGLNDQENNDFKDYITGMKRRYGFN